MVQKLIREQREKSKWQKKEHDDFKWEKLVEITDLETRIEVAKLEKKSQDKQTESKQVLDHTVKIDLPGFKKTTIYKADKHKGKNYLGRLKDTILAEI